MVLCSHCGGKIPASKPSITVNVAPEHAHLAPAGTFHLRAVDESGKNCFEHAVAAHKAVSLQRETVAGG